MFVITTCTGKLIDHFSAVNGEDEVLLSPNSEFVVTKELADVAGTGYGIVEMVERDPEGGAAY